MDRKQFLAASFIGAAAIPEVLKGEPHQTAERPNADLTQMQVCIFSKCLHWLNYRDMAALVAGLGFDGIDLTVRKAGHVLPEQVERDLPLAVSAAKERKLSIPMITTDINTADEPLTNAVLKTAGALGIRYFRTNWYKYEGSISVEENLKVFADRLKGLAALGRKYNVKPVYQNHAGDMFGSAVWDLWTVLEKVKDASCQYDVRHAVAESADGWHTALKLIHPYIDTIAIKDMAWQDNNGRHQAVSVPLGKGQVNYKVYVDMLRQFKISGPATMHFEYPLGGAEDGARTISISGEDFRKAIARDLSTFRKMLAS